MLSTRQLRYFDALARLGHFGRAADHCAVTQPALSMQIMQLEQELGVVLVERRSNGAALTAAGREVARRVSNILLELRGLSEFAATCRGPLTTPVRLGVIPTVAPYLLPRLLPCLLDRYPDLALHIRETQTSTLLSELLAANLDLLMVALPIEHPDIETIDVWSDRFLLAVPTRSSAYGRGRVAPEQLHDERLLLLEEGHCLRDQALAICALSQINGSDILGASSLSTLVQMVASGFGVTLLPEISTTYETTQGGIRLVRFTEPEPTRMLGLAWRRSSPRKAEFNVLGELIKDVWGTQDNVARA